jgi:uncharacterized membrane protein YecN with MAPEG domain
MSRKTLGLTNFKICMVYVPAMNVVLCLGLLSLHALLTWKIFCMGVILNDENIIKYTGQIKEVN